MMNIAYVAILAAAALGAGGQPGTAATSGPAPPTGVEVTHFALGLAGRGDVLAMLTGVGCALLVWFALGRVYLRRDGQSRKAVALKALAVVIVLCLVFAVVRQLARSGGAGGPQSGGRPQTRLALPLGLVTVQNVTRPVQAELTPQRSVSTAGLYFNVRGPRCEVALLGKAQGGDADALVTCTIYVQPEGEEQRSLATVHLPLSGSEWHVSTFDMAEYEDKKCRLLVACAAPGEVPYRVLAGVTTYQARAEDAHNVLVVSMDGTRADHLGCYGYERPTSPAIDKVAGQGVRFENCNAQAPWSYPSLFSMMSAEFPSVLWADQPIGEQRRWHVENVLTLAAALKSAAFYTGAVTGGGPTMPEAGLHQGFDTYRVAFPPRVEETYGHAAAWLKEHAGDRFFLFVQTYEAYPPYRQGPFKAQGDSASEVALAGYDSSISHADWLVAGLMETLAGLGILDRTLVVITSAHGQEFTAPQGAGGPFPGEVGVFGHTLGQSVLHVPLIMRAPDLVPAGKVVDSRVACVDLMPTVLGLLGFEQPEALKNCAGVDLTPLIRVQDPEVPERVIFSEATCWGPEQKALLAGRYKLVYTPTLWRDMTAQDRRVRTPSALKPGSLDRLFDHEHVRLYDLQTDPGEQHNLAARDHAFAAEYIRLMEGLLRRNASLRQTNEGRMVGRGPEGER